MGAGCSSPLRRLGGKRAKASHRADSISVEALGDHDNQKQTTIATRQQLQQQAEQLTPSQKLMLDNEITIQSETNEDHPSTGSCYTDITKNQLSEDAQTKTIGSELQGGIGSNTPASCGPRGQSNVAGTTAARMLGLNGGILAHDRHLLVSPALSPAPSTCQSPAPASSYIGCRIPLDLDGLNDAFKTLTFGSVDEQLKHRIKSPERIQSELHNHYSQQLVQSQIDLVDSISVVLIAPDDPLAANTTKPLNDSQILSSNLLDNLINQIESNMRIFCDEHSFGFRFLNLSYHHLIKSLRVNSLQNVALNILEQEYKENHQRIIVIILTANPSSSTNDSSNAGGSDNKQIFDKRQLPPKIDGQTMNKLNNLISEQNVKDLVAQWYNQVGNYYHLKSIYMVYPKILSESKVEHECAWEAWLNESRIIVQSIGKICDNDPDLAAAVGLDTLFNGHIGYILNHSTLLRRALLVRHTQQSVIGVGGGPTVAQQALSTNSGSKENLNELIRQLADPNKLTMKRAMDDDEYLKTVTDWISENFAKFVEIFVESQIAHGKYVPPFIERHLFIELTCQRRFLEHHLDNITESFESKCQNFYSDHIRPILVGLVNRTLPSQDQQSIDEQNIIGSKQSLRSLPSTNHIIIISGPRGCGKSTLFSQLIRFTAEEFFNQIQIIYRFCGQTKDSVHPTRLLRSICEQFCQTQGENTTAASYVYSARLEIMNALNKTIKRQTCLILLDGLELFNQSLESSLDWLFQINSNSNIKILIMLETDSNQYKEALNTYTEATFISLDNPTVNEWAQMLTSSARSNRFNSAINLYDEIKNLNPTEFPGISTFTYKDVAEILHLCNLRRLNNEFIYPELTIKFIQDSSMQDLKCFKKIILTQLHYLTSPYQLCSLFVAMDSTRNGLYERDIINIMNLISNRKREQQSADNELKKPFTSATLDYLKIQLKPSLRYIVCDKRVKLMFKQDYLKAAIDYYVPKMFPKIVEEVREVLLEYFNRSFKQRQQLHQQQLKSFKTNAAVTEASASNELKEHVSAIERAWLGTQASEIINLLIKTNPTKAKEHIMNKNQFFLQFLHRDTPEEFIEDYERLKTITSRKLSQNEDLQQLVNFIRQSIFPLRYDGSQIYSQIYCRAFDSYKTGKFSRSKKFSEILNVASCPPIRNLLPISEASVNSFKETRIGQLPLKSTISDVSLSNIAIHNKQPSSTAALAPGQKIQTGSSSSSHQRQAPPFQQQQLQQSSKQQIFIIKDNHRHVIVLYPDEGCISVWDIFEEKAARTITNVDQPRDLRMIDQKRAVILCNRELRVYDLDSGSMLTKLKGVMNQKMPFFEVFGEDYVVTLARNRMYVNMLNLNNGELETTFKVGEDRFLNSLLVSANGGICVCGDETQKPFPLLVWNLNERRLLYDLRLEKHEFITRMSAISDDGHFVVSVCKQLGDSNDSHTNSTNSGSSSSAANSMSGGGGGSSSVASHKSAPNFIVIYDLNSGTLFKKWKPGFDTCGVAISISVDRSGKVINSIVDSSILIWDLTTSSRRHTLVGHTAPADVLRVQNNRVFSMDSTSRDQSLRIWDIEEGYCLAVFSPNAPVSCCQLSARGDALVCGFGAETRLSTLVLCKNQTVSEVLKRNKRRKSSKSLYIFDEPPPARKPSS